MAMVEFGLGEGRDLSCLGAGQKEEVGHVFSIQRSVQRLGKLRESFLN